MAIKVSKHRQEEYAGYKSKGRFAANRKRKLTKLLKEQPNNIQIGVAIKNISATPRRGTPNTNHWSHTMKNDVARAKRFNKPLTFVVPHMTEKQMFSFKTRVSENQWSLS